MTSTSTISIDPLLAGLHFSFGVEGGYLSAEEAARIGDPGGETKFGISKRSYPHLDIASLTLAQAEAIYRADFWPHVAAFPAPVAFVSFDFAINSGPARARRYANMTRRDDPYEWALAAVEARRVFLERLGKRRPKTAKGWQNRITRLKHTLKDVYGPASRLPRVPGPAVAGARTPEADEGTA